MAVLPELRGEHPGPTYSQPLTAPGERQRLFEALTHAILGGAGSADAPPLVLLLDDVQWCDRDTLEWLHYLLRAGRRARLLVVCTLRVEEARESDNVKTVTCPA